MYKALKDIISSKEFPNTFFHIILGTKNSNLGIYFNSMTNVCIYDFIDQKTMGALLDLCDVAVTRGGTTSLAEQQLFGIKKIIIPIPWTHDQLKNGLYYKKIHDDILVRQDSKLFVKDFEKALKELK
jgi:UDP-N-acetylglucosamine:LPS N-acetylglucosamine transferase